MENIEYTVVLKGGSIGENNIRNKSQLKNIRVKSDTVVYISKEDAKLKAKEMNKYLSPGEKKYYGLRYIVCEIKNSFYTGK